MCFLSLSILPLKDVCLCSTNFGAWRAVHLVVSFSLLSPSKFRAQLWMNSLTHCNLIFLMCNVRLVVSPAAQSKLVPFKSKGTCPALCGAWHTTLNQVCFNFYWTIFALQFCVFSVVRQSESTLCLHMCCCSVTQLCPTLCNPMDCSRSGLPVPHHLLEFAQIHIHCIGDAVQPSRLLKPSSSALDLSQHQGLFQWLPLFFWFPSHLGHRRALSTLPCAI